MESKYKRLRGVPAHAALKMRVGRKVGGGPALTVEVPVDLLPAVMREATKLGSAWRTGKRYVPPQKLTKRGKRRQRGMHDPVFVDAEIERLLKAKNGKITHRQIKRAINRAGYGVTHEAIAAVRAKLGYPRRADSKWGVLAKILLDSRRRRKSKLRDSKNIPDSQPNRTEPIPAPEPIVRDVCPWYTDGKHRGCEGKHYVPPAADEQVIEVLSPPVSLPLSYLRECVREWNERQKRAIEAVDLATDPLVPLPEVTEAKP